MKTEFRLGVVGLGGHGHTIQHAISLTEGLTIASVYDVSEEETNRSVEMYGCAAADSYDDMLARSDLDAVVIVTPNHLHLDQVSAAVDAGLHIFVEKPIANELDEAVKMVDLARSKDRLLMVGHHMRYNRASRKTKELLDSGDFGQIVSIEMHYSANNTPYYAPDSWRLQPEYCPLLPVTQLAIHGIDVLHYLVGQIDSVVATARSVTVQAPVLDSVSALMHTDNGYAVTLTSNYCSPVLFEIRIATTTRNIVYTPHLVSVTPTRGMQGDDDEWTHYDYTDDTDDGYEIEMNAFRDALVAGTLEVETGGAEALQALAVDVALRQSIASGSQVMVEDFAGVTG